MHETACRLEHAIDDDLEVALTVLLGNPMLDPSGREIPSSGEHLEQRVRSFTRTLVPLSQLAEHEFRIHPRLSCFRSVEVRFWNLSP